MNDPTRAALRRLGLLRQDPEPPTGSREKRCDSCHQRIRKRNPHHMCVQKWRVLDAMAGIHQKGNAWVKVEEGRELSFGEEGFALVAYRAGQHVARLKWFGLVDHKGRRTAMYRVNRQGFLFLAGKLSVPETIWCRDGAVEDCSTERTFVSEVKGVTLDKAYWDRYSQYQVDPPPGGSS